MQTKRKFFPYYLLRYGVLPPILIGLVMAFRIFIFIPLRVKTDSMFPKLPRGTWVLGLKHKMPQRGDFVLYQTKGSPTTYLGRLVAEPGDSLKLNTDSLFIGGKLVQVYPRSSTTNYQLYIPKVGEICQVTPKNLVTYRPLIADTYHKPIDSITWAQGRLWIGARATEVVQFRSPYYWILVDQPNEGTDSRQLGLIRDEDILAVVLFYL